MVDDSRVRGYISFFKSSLEKGFWGSRWLLLFNYISSSAKISTTRPTEFDFWTEIESFRVDFGPFISKEHFYFMFVFVDSLQSIICSAGTVDLEPDFATSEHCAFCSIGLICSRSYCCFCFDWDFTDVDNVSVGWSLIRSASVHRAGIDVGMSDWEIL